MTSAYDFILTVLQYKIALTNTEGIIIVVSSLRCKEKGVRNEFKHAHFKNQSYRYIKFIITIR